MPVTRRAFVRTLFVASQTAMAGRLMSAPLDADDPYAGAINFAVIGDWGRRGRPDQVQVARQMALSCKKAQANFIVSVGDNFYENGVASVEDPQWQQTYEKVYSAASLQVPWYVVLGNHDYRGNCEAQIDYGKTHPRWVMPARYYTHLFPIDASSSLECFFIDTSPMIGEYKTEADMKAIFTQDVKRQLDWLDQSLAASKAQWKLVFGHHPIYSAGTGHGNQEDMIRLVLPILEKNKVQSYFSGHDHDLQYLKDDEMNFYISGGGSEHLPVKAVPKIQFAQDISGFLLVSVRHNDTHVRFIDSLGNTIYTTTATPLG